MMDAMDERNVVGIDVFGEDLSIKNWILLPLCSSYGKIPFLPFRDNDQPGAIKCHTQPGDEVIGDEAQHAIVEGGGYRFNSGARQTITAWPCRIWRTE